jgi:hypothetical protein
MLTRRVLLCVLVGLVRVAAAEALTIRDVQYDPAGWQSPYYDESSPQIVSVSGGVVTYAAGPPGKPWGRVVIQDPNETDWAGVEVKLLDDTPVSTFQVGQRVDFADVLVDESYGTTYLIFDSSAPAAGGYGSSYSLGTTGHSVPPTTVAPGVLGAGDDSADPAAAEKYEGMLLKVLDVTVSLDGGLGSHNDNYELTGAGGTCWAADYMNVDRAAGDDFHAWTQTGRHWDAVIGVLEQYTKPIDAYDYYQLLTRSSADFVPAPLPAAVLLAAAPLLLQTRRRD